MTLRLVRGTSVVQKPQGRLTFRELGDALNTIEALADTNPHETAFMRYRVAQGGKASTLSKNAWRSWDAVSPYALCAIVQSEDPLFFRHNGFWWAEVRRQIRKARAPWKARGVSTITQQLARNLFLRPERTLKRKFYEALITAQLEHTLPKTRILELHLNVVEWGVGVWGIEAASLKYFQHSSNQMSPFEAVFLASLLPAPLLPLTGANAVRAIRAQRRLTSLLYGSGIISHTVEGETFTRINQLEAVIKGGGDVAEFLIATDDICRYRADVGPSLNAAQVVRVECGLAQRIQFEYFVRESVSHIRGITVWPEWWSPPS